MNRRATSPEANAATTALDHALARWVVARQGDDPRELLDAHLEVARARGKLEAHPAPAAPRRVHFKVFARGSYERTPEHKAAKKRVQPSRDKLKTELTDARLDAIVAAYIRAGQGATRSAIRGHLHIADATVGASLARLLSINQVRLVQRPTGRGDLYMPVASSKK